MKNRVICDKCGQKIDVPAGHDRPKVRCPMCGYYAVVPAEMRTTAAAIDDELPTPVPAEPVNDDTPRPPPKTGKVRAKPAGKDPGPPLLVGTQDEDDDNPYAVPGDGTKKCPACRKELPLDATFCVHCGGDLSAGTKKKRAFQPIDLSWESTAPLSLRLKAFLGFQALNAFMVFNIMNEGANGVALGMVFLNVVMQAFLVGTYDRLTVKRTAKGTATLTKQWRVCFLPQPTSKVDWKKSHGVGIIALHDPWLMEWGMFLLLLSSGTGQMAAYATGGGSMIGWVIVLPLSFGPAIAWYWYVIRPDRFHVALTDEYGSTNEIVFRTTQRETADEICRTVNDATGLWYKKVL